MANKKTAVDYLINQISDIIGRIKPNVLDTLLFITALEEAKKMEKEQIINAFKCGESQEMILDEIDSEDYYNKTYGK
jgi:hypothetical protein